jgi:hypothetical protein
LTLAADLPDAADDVLREALARAGPPAGQATEFMRRLRQALADAGRAGGHGSPGGASGAHQPASIRAEGGQAQ